MPRKQTPTSTTPSKLRKRSVPVYYNGQNCEGEPDHFVSAEEAERLKKTGDARTIHRGLALILLTSRSPRFPAHVDSNKTHWMAVGHREHSFQFHRDYGALEQRLGTTVMNLLR